MTGAGHMAVLSFGPLVAFGFLLIPALTAHTLTRNMCQFTGLACLIGGVAAFCERRNIYRVPPNMVLN